MAVVNRKRIQELRAERDEAYSDLQKACSTLGSAQHDAYDAGKAAANVETLKCTVADHPWATMAIAAGGTMVATKLIRKLPFKSIGVTALSIVAKTVVPKVINHYIAQYSHQGNGAEPYVHPEDQQ